LHNELRFSLIFQTALLLVSQTYDLQNEIYLRYELTVLS